LETIGYFLPRERLFGRHYQKDVSASKAIAASGLSFETGAVNTSFLQSLLLYSSSSTF
jgi:hypothetical protein